ncbi:MAG: carbon-nitrogen family hydrolase [Anaerolineae bacterium]|nr:carbon-nitrogen family hydrolase [Anaerolineae bacterium]MCO5189228.1 carbon-nitrogen family hydrolase [Anaerolineae bacterium]
MSKLHIALAQFDLVFGDPQANLTHVARFSAEAAQRGADVLVLPELWSTAYDLEKAERHATLVDEGVFAAVRQLARQHRLTIIGSSLSVLGPERYGNTATVATPDGTTAAVYSKLHLFRLMQEEQFLAAGDRAVSAEMPWGKLGLGICYDLRFPELFRHYALDGVQIVFLPSEWPHPRLMHWRTLLRARAIENQLFVVACNRIGRVGDTHFFGHSAVIDPWGETVLEAGDVAGLFSAEIDLDLVAAVRRKIPIFADRRPDVYGS